ncbi:hypothetical protein DENSPDRAFT_503174 [Dentipellis sp. KUC8613]|nr:hypothetical protein DENSPDRAFT_503174 [Dentipellis sp. KUC8613]
MNHRWEKVPPTTPPYGGAHRIERASSVSVRKHPVHAPAPDLLYCIPVTPGPESPRARGGSGPCYAIPSQREPVAPRSPPHPQLRPPPSKISAHDPSLRSLRARRQR